MTDALIIDLNAVKLTRLEFWVRRKSLGDVKVVLRLALGGGYWIAEGEGLENCQADTIGQTMKFVLEALGERPSDL